MLRGVIQMPYEMAMASDISRYQYHCRAQQLLSERDTLQAEVDALRARINNSPVAFMDTRVTLGLCALTEADFPALYAMAGKRVAIVELV
jgi:hypothetical protein